MSAVRMRRCLFAFVCAVTVCIVCLLLPAHSADFQREKDARALLAEGEKLNEATQPAAALEIFERVAKEYPDTESGMFAQFRRAETLVFLGQCTEAIARARMVIDAYPNTPVAAWSQYAIGQALLKQQGRPDEAVRALRKVKSMLPNKLDLGALEGSRIVLAQLIQQHYGFSESMDPLAPASLLEVARSDSKGKAELYAIVAFHWGRAGRIDLANPVLDRIAQECPEEKDELEWAKAEVGMGYLNIHNEGDSFVKLATDLLMPVLSSPAPNDQSAKAAICLARFYKRSGKYAEAAGVLKGAIEKHIDTAHAPEMLYELASVLRKQGENDEAVKVLNRIVAEKPVSRYRVAAERLIEEIGKSTPETQASLDELIKEADAKFDPKWKNLANAPKDGSLGDAVMVSRQAVALAREDKPELALGLLDRFAAQHGISTGELEKAKCEVALCSLRAGAQAGRISREAIYVVALLSRKSGTEKQSLSETQASLLSRAVEIVKAMGTEAMPGAEAAGWADWRGIRYMDLGRYRDAINAFSAELKLGGRSAEIRARATYHTGLCYYRRGYYNSAKRSMEQVARKWPGNTWSRKAQGVLYLWSTYGVESAEPPEP